MQKQPPEVFYIKKAVLKNLIMFGETPVLEFLFNKVAGLQQKCFSVNLGNL